MGHASPSEPGWAETVRSASRALAPRLVVEGHGPYSEERRQDAPASGDRNRAPQCSLGAVDGFSAGRVHLVRRGVNKGLLLTSLSAVAGAVGVPQAAGAHAVVTPSDPPMPSWMFVLGAGLAILVTFLAVSRWWTTPRFGSAGLERVDPAGPWADRIARAFGAVGAVVAFVAWILTIVAGWFGEDHATVNIAPLLFMVIMWVGVPMVSLFFGDVWGVWNPISRVLAGLDRLGVRPDPKRSVSMAAANMVAAAGIGAYLWMELVAPAGGSPRSVAAFVSIHAVVLLGGAFVFGKEWATAADPFSRWFHLAGTCAPWRLDGKTVQRVPWLSRLAATSFNLGLLVLVLVHLGGTTFDGLTRSTWWQDQTYALYGWDLVPKATLTMVACICLMAVVYLLAAGSSAQDAGLSRFDAALRWGNSLVPIALGYAVAHYFAYFFVAGSGVVSLVSDPLGRGWDIFGTADWTVGTSWLTPGIVAWSQLIGIVGGHIGGVIVAHDRALELVDRDSVVRQQVPLLIAMVIFTVVGLALLLQG